MKKQNHPLNQALIKILFNIMDIEDIVEEKGIEEIRDRLEEIKRIIVEVIEEE